MPNKDNGTELERAKAAHLGREDTAAAEFEHQLTERLLAKGDAQQPHNDWQAYWATQQGPGPDGTRHERMSTCSLCETLLPLGSLTARADGWFCADCLGLEDACRWVRDAYRLIDTEFRASVADPPDGTRAEDVPLWLLRVWATAVRKMPEAGRGAWLRGRVAERWSELRRSKAEADAAADRNPLGFRALADVGAARREPSWLVRESLLSDAYAVVGGAEKTLKSIIMTMYAVAVASGSPLFCHEQFAVPRRGRVLVLTGEGSVDLFYDRVEHLCKACGVDFGELLSGGWIEVTDKIKPTNSDVFRAGLARRIEDYDPALVIVDPAYVYMPATDGAAGNVFHMGQLLADLRDQCRGRALMVGHHFTKAGANDLSLSSLTQAGFRESADHWLLVAHAEPPDLDNQRFVLRARMGARRGFGWDAEFRVGLGPFDLDTLRHGGAPTWEVLRDAALASANDDDDTGWRYWRRHVWQDIRDAPWTRTQADLMGGDHPGLRRRALDWLRDKDVATTRNCKGPNGERRADRWGPTLDYEDATEARLGDLWGQA